jgi:hypothetical protein
MTETLAGAIESAYDAQQGQTATATPTEGNQGSETPGASLIDIEDGSSTGEGAQQATASAQQQVAWELAQGVAADTVIGTMDGKPVTAGEVRDSFFRTQDYTKKTQEIAKEREEHQSYKQWYSEAEPYLKGLNSPDPAVRMQTVQQLAQSYGVELGGGRQRDERGRFASQQQESEGLIDLEQFDEDSAEYQLASTINAERQQRSAMQSKLDEISAKFEQFTGSVASAYENNQRKAEAETLAAKYQAAGLDGLDVDGALELVGKPLDVAQAMRLHHYDKIMRHNFALAKGGTPQTVPNEPASSAGPGKGSLRGKSLTASFDERIR